MSKLGTVSVIGLGYVGLPLAIAFGKHSKVIGFDIDTIRIDELQKGIDKVCLTGKGYLEQSDVLYTDNPDELSNANFHIVTVSTPINNTNQPDLRSLFSASETLGSKLKKEDIVVFESTVYPGLTEEECIPILESSSGLKCGQDFYVGYSPERINPGDTQHCLENTIKIVSAQDDKTLEKIAVTYESVVESGVYRASSIKVAEAAKVIENTQRDINIALMNELALIFRKMDIDTADVLEAAGTKWNFLKFSPGLVGGHCIGVDPYYLTHKAMLLNYSPRVILSGRSVNDSMGHYVARMVIKDLIKSGIIVKDANVIILGFTFKENIPDIRNTRVIDMIKELESFGVNIQIYDPLVDKNDVKNEYDLILCDKEDLKPSHGVILAVIHEEFIEGGWTLIEQLLENGKGAVFDVKSVLTREDKPEGISLQRL